MNSEMKASSNTEQGDQGMTNDQLTTAVSQSKVVYEDAIPPASGELASAMEADKERLNLVARSYAKDHPKQYVVNRSRILLRAVEVANRENRKELNLQQREGEKMLPHSSEQTHKEALGMVRGTLEAAEKDGFQIKHELSNEWAKEAGMEKVKEMDMGHGKE